MLSFIAIISPSQAASVPRSAAAGVTEEATTDGALDDGAGRHPCTASTVPTAVAAINAATATINR
jgi:hypothetical protein